MVTSKQLLKTAGILTFAVALFQAVVTTSPEWSRYFGAWEPVVSKLWLLYLTGFLVAFIFTLFGFYALSGAGIIKRLPLLPAALVVIGVLFTLRGLFLAMELLINAGILQGSMIIPTREIISSSVSLMIGILYLIGTIRGWSSLTMKTKIIN